MKRVLVTGAMGQVGNAVFMRFLSEPERYDAYALDRSASFSERVPGSWENGIPAERFIQCDLGDLEGLRRAMRGMDAVAHLAADPEGRTFESVLQNNVIGTYNVFEACRLEGVKRLVVASSIMVSEGHFDEAPYRDILDVNYDAVPADYAIVSPRIPAEPRSLYGCSKVWSESLARTYAYRHDMSCLAIRIGQVERDRPRPPRGASYYVSVRDIVQIWQRAIDADPSLRFDVFYGVSNNDYRWVDIEHAREVLGYEPQDRAEDGHTYESVRRDA